jgi:hypothetical protein
LSAARRKARTEIPPAGGKLKSAERRDFFHGGVPGVIFFLVSKL